MAIVDCTLTIESTDRWHEYPMSDVFDVPSTPTRVDETVAEVADDGTGARVTRLEMTTHSFTHVDAPRHWRRDGTSIDAVDPARFVGEATVFDCSHKGAGEVVTAEDLEKTGRSIGEGEIAIVRTDWTDEAWGTKRFWTESIGLGTDAGEWLLDNGVKGIALDFYHEPRAVLTDEAGAFKRELPPHENHRRLLSEHGILFYESCVNFGEIDGSRVSFTGLPLKIGGADASPVRVIVEE